MITFYLGFKFFKKIFVLIQKIYLHRKTGRLHTNFVKVVRYHYCCSSFSKNKLNFKQLSKLINNFIFKFKYNCLKELWNYLLA